MEGWKLLKQHLADTFRATYMLSSLLLKYARMKMQISQGLTNAMSENMSAWICLDLIDQMMLIIIVCPDTGLSSS